MRLRFAFLPLPCRRCCPTLFRTALRTSVRMKRRYGGVPSGGAEWEDGPQDPIWSVERMPFQSGPVSAPRDEPSGTFSPFLRHYHQPRGPLVIRYSGEAPVDRRWRKAHFGKQPA